MKEMLKLIQRLFSEKGQAIKDKMTHYWFSLDEIFFIKNQITQFSWAFLES